MAPTLNASLEEFIIIVFLYIAKKMTRPSRNIEIMNLPLPSSGFKCGNFCNQFSECEKGALFLYLIPFYNS